MPLAHGLDSLVRVSRRVEQVLTYFIMSVHLRCTQQNFWGWVFWIFWARRKERWEKKKRSRNPFPSPFLPMSYSKPPKEGFREEPFLAPFFKIFYPRSWAQWLVKWFLFSNEEKKISEERFLFSASKGFSCARSPTLNRCWRACYTVYKMAPYFFPSGKEKKNCRAVVYTARQTTTPFEINKMIRGFKTRSLPPQQLQVLWTLFSKFFCNFPSRYLYAIDLPPEYLALDGVYHPY